MFTGRFLRYNKKKDYERVCAMEIERKFLVKTLPAALSQYPASQIWQAYLSFVPEIRIRKKDGRYLLTEKGEGALARSEEEREISASDFAARKAGRISNPIEKTRYRIPLEGGLTAELDVFSGKLTGLCLVEVEFSSYEAAEGFLPPGWFGDEVTYIKKFKNKNLSLLDAWD